MYKPLEPFTTMAELFNPTYSTVKGVSVKKYEWVGFISCLFKTYGGTETTINDVYGIIDTANVETWYRPDISSASRLMVNNKAYEVVGEPENISMRNQYLKFKVRRVKGGA